MDVEIMIRLRQPAVACYRTRITGVVKPPVLISGAALMRLENAFLTHQKLSAFTAFEYNIFASGTIYERTRSQNPSHIHGKVMSLYKYFEVLQQN